MTSNRLTSRIIPLLTAVDDYKLYYIVLLKVYNSTADYL